MKKQFISFFAVISLALGPVGCSDNTAEIAQKTILILLLLTQSTKESLRF